MSRFGIEVRAAEDEGVGLGIVAKMLEAVDHAMPGQDDPSGRAQAAEKAQGLDHRRLATETAALAGARQFVARRIGSIADRSGDPEIELIANQRYSLDRSPDRAVFHCVF